VSYQKTVLRTWKENVLFSALVELTYRCNLDCFFCYNDLALRGKPMELDDYERFFRDLASLSCLHLTLSGGEPLVHPRFFEIAAKGRSSSPCCGSSRTAIRLRPDATAKEEIDPRRRGEPSAQRPRPTIDRHGSRKFSKTSREPRE
jgi:MoaA/NifB/PqqE/SkfB family radical SAM enzyme